MPPQFVSHDRHLQFTKYLQDAGYKVTNISASFVWHEDGLDLVSNGGKFKTATYNDFLNFIHIKVRHYKGNGLARMYSIFQFAFRLLRFRNKFEKPDIILHNSHMPFDFPIVTCAKRLKAKYIAEEWDLWPDDFVTFGLISAHNPIMKWAYAKERQMFQTADAIVFSFAGGLNYLQRHHWTINTGGDIDESNVYYINNGLSIETFNRNKERYIIDEIVLNSSKFKVVYLGGIRLVNNVKILIDAIALLNNIPDIQLLVYGDGNERDELIQYVKNNHIDNVQFMSKRIPLEYCAYVYSHADINILNYTKGFADYGISAGKLMQSLGAGKPLLCNVPIGFDDVITENNLGICETLDTPQKYAEAILKIFNLPKEEYVAMCSRVKEVAKRFDYQTLSQNLINIIEGLAE